MYIPAMAFLSINTDQGPVIHCFNSLFVYKDYNLILIFSPASLQYVPVFKAKLCPC